MITLVCKRCGTRYEALTRGRKYCSEYCRRQYQNERRQDERAELRALREAEKARPMTDFWSRSDLDEWTAEMMLANALLDPMPSMYDSPADKLRRVVDRMKDKEMAKAEGGLRQLWLC